MNFQERFIFAHNIKNNLSMKLVVNGKGILERYFFVFLVMFTPLLVKAHAIQLAWSVTCQGKFRLFIEHWHTSNFVPSTTMEIDYTINGVTTRRAGVLVASINTSFNTLPTSTTPIISFAACPSANTENFWAVYDFDSIPCSVAVDITVIGGNNNDVADGCGMFPASVGTIQIPCPSPITILPNQEVCANDSVPPTSLQSFGQAGTIYHWTNSNPNIGLASSGIGQQLPGFTTPTSSVTEVAEISIYDNCNEAKFYIIVHPRPKPNCVLSLSDSTILDSLTQYTVCWNDIISLTVTQNFESYNWSNGDSTSSISPSIGGLYFVEVTDSNGCKEVSDSIQIHMNHMLPSIINAPNGDSYCEGDNLLIYADSNWTNLNWVHTSDTIDSLFISTPGIYSYTALDDSGCLTLSDSIFITEYTNPIVSIVPINEDSVCLYDSVFLSSANNLEEYLWSNGSSLSGSFFNLTALGDTIFYLNGTDQHGCQNRDSIIIKVVDCNAYDAINENQINFEINVINNQVSIISSKPFEKVEIINTAGQIVLSENNFLSKELTLNIDGIQSGVYFIRLFESASQRVGTKKINIYSQ